MAQKPTALLPDRRPDEPETVLLPAGPFWMGSQPGIPDYETPQHTVELPAHWIAQYPIIHTQYQLSPAPTLPTARAK